MLAANVAFLMVFIIPKFEKIFADFNMRVPEVTEFVLRLERLAHAPPLDRPQPGAAPPVGDQRARFSIRGPNGTRRSWAMLYRMHARGQFLQTLGLMMESGKPLPEILDNVNDSGLLPKAIAVRTRRLASDIARGEPLAESLAKNGLLTAYSGGLVAAAERARNLPWALRELGETLVRRSARISHRLAMVLFPLAIFACASLVALFAVAMFSPLTALLRGMTGG